MKAKKAYEVKRIRKVSKWCLRRMKPTRDEIAFMTRYTARICRGRQWIVEFIVFHQGFQINDCGGMTAQEADWTRLMLAKAAMTLVKQERLYPFSGLSSCSTSRKRLAKSAH